MRTSPSSQLALNDVTKRYDDHVVLDRISLTVKPGEKVGIIGDNGSGKSTLLRLLAGCEPSDNGEISVHVPGGVGYLPQAQELHPDSTVQDAVDAALSDLRHLERQLRNAESAMAHTPRPRLASLMADYARLTERFDARGGYEADRRVDLALHGLGLPGLERHRPLSTLSGGERSRLALAGTLASGPELLLLDEPTNDLDDQALGWLEEHLRAHAGTVVVVTHDRVFLDNLTSTILEVDAARVTRYGDGWAGYLTAKAAERRRLLREYDDWRADIARNQQLVQNNVARLEEIPRKLPFAVFGHGGFRSRGRGHGAMSRIRNAKERVDRLTSTPVAPPAERLVFTARIAPTVADQSAGTDSCPARSGEAADQVIDLADIGVNGRLRLPGLRVRRDERVLVTGPNGAGKTTLMRVIAGELTPDTGTVRVRGRIGHLRQDELPLPGGLTVLQAFTGRRHVDPDEDAERLLSLGLFAPDQIRLRVGQLSYGQRRRIELARLVSRPIDVLLLDEPTNHLSPALVEDLEAALETYRGALVMVTHDRRIRSRFAGTELGLDNGQPVCRDTRAGTRERREDRSPAPTLWR